MTSACSTGRAAAVTMPRMFSAAGSWRESEYAVLVLPRMAHANAIAKNRRIAPLPPLVRAYGHAAGESNRDWRAKPPPSRPGGGWRVAGNGKRVGSQVRSLGSHTPPADRISPQQISHA